MRAHFPDAIGSDAEFGYPTDHAGAAAWLDGFVRERLASFGDYEDAISTAHDVLFHSVLTPMLNVGLLSPRQVIDAVIAQAGRVPLNSLEGVVRQVIGWREFVRLVYLTRGRGQHTRNFWGFTRDIPAAFYDGGTGIGPVDHVVRQVLRTGYCHHIERLMILGNFLLLCDIHPDVVYRWFMELFVDAYDWVMVPQRLRDEPARRRGVNDDQTVHQWVELCAEDERLQERCVVCCLGWSLDRRFVNRHADFFGANPRMAVIVKMKDKLGDRLKEHLRVADAFLAQLHR